MGQKVNPHGLRVGVIKDWDSRWYADADFADYLVEDYNIRTFLKKKLYSAGVSKIEIERASDRVKVIIYTACLRQDLLKYRRAVAHLHDAHAAAVIVQHFGGDLLQNGLRHHSRSGGKIINTVISHGGFLAI